MPEINAILAKMRSTIIKQTRTTTTTTTHKKHVNDNRPLVFWNEIFTVSPECVRNDA